MARMVEADVKGKAARDTEVDLVAEDLAVAALVAVVGRTAR
jgi:hypothetical protein